jgi:hypothetical protein
VTVQDSLFDTGPLGSTEWPTQPRMLLSYAYANKLTAEDFDALDHADVVIDSGAFTAASTGKQVDHAAYLGWLTDHASTVHFALALDSIGDPVTSMANYFHGRDVLEDRVRLVPTWHVGSPWDVLDRYCQETDYVAIGGAVKYYQEQGTLFKIARHAHDIAAEHGTRLHGLGMTGRRVMRQLPWASVDSSSWTISKRLPFLYLAAQRGNVVSLNYGRPMPEWHKDLVRVYGGDPTGMEDEGWAMKDTVGEELAAARKAWGAKASARSYMYVEVSKVDPGSHGFRVYLASSPRDTLEITDAHRLGNPWVAS